MLVDPRNLFSKQLNFPKKILSAMTSGVSVAMLIGVTLCVSSCDKEHLGGTLTVRHVAGGSYEIYKIASEQPLQFVSETSSQFNEQVSLAPGSYMVLADCSSEIVNIYLVQTSLWLRTVLILFRFSRRVSMINFPFSVYALNAPEAARIL